MPPSDPPDDRPRSVRREEGAVDPDELDYTESERVAELSEGRYVVSTDDGEPSVDEAGDGDDVTDAERRRLARQQMARYVSDQESEYGFALTAAFDGEIVHHDDFSDDVATAFGELVRWYVEQIDTDTVPTEAIGILLLASETRVTYPEQALASILQQHDLGPDDSIRDLVDAIADEGLQIPPEE